MKHRYATRAAAEAELFEGARLQDPGASRIYVHTVTIVLRLGGLRFTLLRSALDAVPGTGDASSNIRARRASIPASELVGSSEEEAKTGTFERQRQ